MADVAELGQKLKAKHPGAYDQMDDAEVGRRVKAKYPGAYDQFEDTAAAPAAQPFSVLDTAKGVATGVAKGAGKTLLGAYEGIRRNPIGAAFPPLVLLGEAARATGRMPDLLPPPPVWMTEGVEAKTLPEKIGQGLEQGAEFLLPGKAITLGTKAIQASSKAPALLKMLARPLMEAAGAGSVAAVQSGGKPEEVAKAAGTAGVLSAALPVFGKVAKYVLGQTTGAGAEAVGAAMSKPTPAFKQAMRGGIDEQEIVANFKDALHTVRDMRGAKYLQQLQVLPQTPLNPSTLTGIRQKMFDKLQSFGVKPSAKGLDWSRATIPKDEAVENIVSDVMNWGSKADDLTPLGMDTLKRRIDNYYSPTRDSRAFIQTVKDEVRQALNREVPGYAQMTKDYAQASDFINKVTSEMSLGPTSQTGTAIRKLTYALKQNNEYRKVLTEMLDEYVGTDLKSQLAGYHMSKFTPRGLMGPATGVGLLTAISAGALTPKLAVAALLSSPRLVGETLAAMFNLKPLTGALPKLGAAAVTNRVELPPPPPH